MTAAFHLKALEEEYRYILPTSTQRVGALL
jgi:hypothetical protein